jgi:hypothetical protein
MPKRSTSFIYKYMLLIALASCAKTSIADQGYSYPKKIILNMLCKEIPNEKIKSIEKSFSHPDFGKEGLVKAIPVDLNGDGACEVYLDNATMNEGNGHPYTTVITNLNKLTFTPAFTDKEYNAHHTDIPGDPTDWQYATFRNGYPRILVPTNISGNKVDQVIVIAVYYYNGNKYELEFIPSK